MTSTFKNILVPFDGSNHARKAYDLAKTLIGEDPDATITVLGVIPMQTQLDSSPGATIDGVPMAFVDADKYHAYVKQLHEKAEKKILEDLGDDLDDIDARFKVEVAAGTSPARSICEFAKEKGCDIIIMGRRGLGAVRGALGSVSFAVLRETDIPVLTVK